MEHRGIFNVESKHHGLEREFSFHFEDLVLLLTFFWCSADRCSSQFFLDYWKTRVGFCGQAFPELAGDDAVEIRIISTTGEGALNG